MQVKDKGRDRTVRSGQDKQGSAPEERVKELHGEEEEEEERRKEAMTRCRGQGARDAWRKDIGHRACRHVVVGAGRH